MIYPKHLALRFSLYALSAYALANSPYALAESTADTTTTDNNSDIEETFVSATRTTQSPFETLASVDILSQENILDYQFSDLAEAFETFAGTDITRNGGLGSNASFFSRGTNNGHTLMLINGQRFSSATSGQSSLELLDPLLIKKAEYVRGSRSSIYGSEAIGGVVQLFTVDPKAEDESYLHLEAGSFNTFRGGLGTHANVGQLSYSAGVSVTDSDNIDHLVDDTDKNADKDGFERISLNLFGQYTFDSEAELSLSYLRNQSQSDYDSAYSSDIRFYRNNLIEASQVSLYLPIAETFNSQFNLGLSRDESLESDDSFFDTQRHSLFWQSNWALTKVTELNFGVDYYQENVNALLDYAEEDRESFATFAQLQSEMAIFDVLLGLRSDDNSSYEGSETLGSLAVGLNIDNSHRLYLSWNEGFKAPTFNDLYWPFLGNENLLPESSENTEIGFKAQYALLSWELSAYHYDIENLINWAPNDEGAYQPQNVNSAEIDGAELSLSTTLSAFYIDASYSYTDTKDKDSDQALDYRAKRKFSLLAKHTLEQFNYGFIFKSLSGRQAFGEAIDDYSVIDIFANIELHKDFTLGFKVSNLLDEDYRTRPDYNTEGRNAKASLHYTF